MTPDDITNIVHFKPLIVLFDSDAKPPAVDAISCRAAKPDTMLQFPERQSSALSDKLLQPHPAPVSSMSRVTAIAPGQSPSGWPNRINRSRESGPLKVAPTAEIRGPVACKQLAIDCSADEGMDVEQD